MEKSHTQNKQRLYGTYSEFIHSIDTRREVLMEKYVLQPDEAILFEDDVSIVESKTNDHIILTNLNVVIESTEKKYSKKVIPR